MSTRVFAMAAVVAALGSSAAWAKPVYLTVPRTFSTLEEPIIDLAFESKGAVELRVLKPRDLDAFLAAQANLRRAYTQVRKEDNPAAYLWRGLNGVKSPQSMFFDALSPDFKRNNALRFPARSVARTTANDGPLARFTEDPELSIAPPAGMDLVKREWLNLDLGGTDADYSVPGFDSGGEARTQERRVALERLPAGVYVVQLVQEKVEGQVTLVVTDLTVQVRQTDDQVLVRVAGVDKVARPGARITLRDAERLLKTVSTDGNGEVLIDGVTSPRLLITAQVAEDVAVVDTDFFSAASVTPETFLYTDRPIYKPGDTAHFKGILREPGSALQRVFFPRERSVKVQLENDASVATAAVVDRFGTFTGSLKIPERMAPGVLRVLAVVDDHPAAAEARVQNYEKPTFYVELIPTRDGITPGSPLTAKARVRRYAGGQPQHARYEAFLYRTRVETPAWVDDAGLGGKGSAVTYNSATTKEGMLSVPELLGSTLKDRADVQPSEPSDGDEEGVPFNAEDPWASAPTFDENGEADISMLVPALESGDAAIAWKYSLVVRARDSEGGMASSAKPFYLADVDVAGQLSVNTRLILWDAKDAAEPTLSVRAVALSGAPYKGASGNVYFTLHRVDGSRNEIGGKPLVFEGDSVARVTVPRSDGGTLHANVTLKDARGKTWEGETTVLVAGKPGETVARVPSLTAEALETTVDADGEARLLALLPEHWGPGGANHGKVWISLSGARIHSSSMVSVDGTTFMHRIPMEERFGTAVHAQLAYPSDHGRWETQTVSFRILPTRKVLTVEVLPVVLEALPMTQQTVLLRVTDHEGRGVPASLSVAVVDKAVLAVQPEFRPAILDFFYPLQRNNASDFFSADFQGYGYGELVSRGLLRGRGFNFAAIKPPTHLQSKDERDTALWDGQVTTGQDGRAVVSFKLPSNQTLWNVSVVAADASGRFGDGRAEFASRTGFSVATAVPQFLRAGDTVSASVRLSNTEKKDHAGVHLSMSASGGLASVQRKETLTVGKTMEQLWPVDLTASHVGVGKLTVHVSDGSVQRTDSRVVPVLPSASHERVNVGGWGNAPLTLTSAPGATLTDVTLTLMPSSLGAVLQNVRDLLTYPHGCLEQLVSTTVPNIAILQTLKTSGASLDGETRALLDEADSRARQGIERILGLSLTNGGFVWFNGETTPSVPLTLIALDGLAYAVEAGIVPSSDSRMARSTEWLASQTEVDPAYLPLRAYVLARLQGAKAAPVVRQALEASGDLETYGAALLALAAEHAGISRETATQERVAAAVTRARDGMLVAWRPSRMEPYYRLPMRSLGVTAIAAHATERAGQMDDQRTRNVRQVLLGALANRSALSTLDRSTLILHSQWLLKRDMAGLTEAPDPTVRVAGADQAVTFQRGAGVLTASLADGVMGPVTVHGFEGAVSLAADVVTPFQTLEKESRGLVIIRTYEVLRNGTRVALAAGETVTRGELVFVRLQFSEGAPSDQWWRSAYYVLEDEVPAGFVPVQEDKEYRGAPLNLPLSPSNVKQRVFRSERVTFYVEEPAPWGQHARELGYVMRAQFPGTFSTGPAWARDMYAAGREGHTAAASFKIVQTK